MILKKLASLMSTNMFVSICALFVSLCAVIISVQEIRIMRKQQSASMYPYVTVGKTYNGQGFGIEAKNSGNGLARIESYKLHIGKKYFENWTEVLNTLAPDAKTIDYSLFSTSGNIRNQMISPGEIKNLIFLKWTDETRKLEPAFQNLEVEICYSSLLGDHWVISDGTPSEISQSCQVNLSEEFNP